MCPLGTRSLKGGILHPTANITQEKIPGPMVFFAAFVLNLPPHATLNLLRIVPGGHSC